MALKKYNITARLGWILLAALPVSVLADEPQDDLQNNVRATPYRPTVSNPAELSLPGWLEAELGWQLVQSGDTKTRNSMPYLFKLAVNEDWGILVGGDGYVNQIEAKESIATDGFGNVVLLSKHRVALGETGALGVEWGAAHQTFDGGQIDYIANGIYSQDIGPIRVDTNVSATYLGDSEPGENRWVVGWASAVSFPISEQWGGAVEFSGAHQGGTPEFAQFMATVSYTYHPRVVFDAGVAAGLTDTAQDWTVFAGMTVLLFRIF